MHTMRLMYRFIAKNKGMTAINLVGLTVGMMVFLLIALFLKEELSYDRGFSKSDRIVLIESHFRIGGEQEFHVPALSAPMPVAFKAEIPEILDYCRIDQNSRELSVSNGSMKSLEKNSFFADSSFFDFFDYDFIRGDRKQALTKPRTVAISERVAEKYFRNEDPIGKQLIYSERDTLSVTGVFAPLSTPTHFEDISLVISWNTRNRDDNGSWLNNVNWPTYLLLNDQEGLPDVAKKINDSFERHMGEMMKQIGGEFSATLMPLLDIHLHAKWDMMEFANGSWQTVVQLAAVALFVILIAGLNFVNLSTAVSMRRAVSVGVSKTVGATQNQLVRQFIMEAILVSVIAVLIALVLTAFLLPGFSSLFESGTRATLNIVQDWWILLLALALAVLTGLLAGAYPAFVLASFKPSKVLKGEFRRGASGSKLRRVLVILQFSLSVLLIISTLIVMQQMNFMRKKDIGFDTEQVLAVRLANWDLMTRHKALKHELKKVPGVMESATADHTPFGSDNNNLYHVPGTAIDNQLLISVKRVDTDFLPLMKMRFLSGRNFDPTVPSDTLGAVIINQAAARLLGYEDPVGKTIDEYEELNPPTFNDLRIIGLIEDYNFESMHYQIRPLFFRIYVGQPVYLFFRLSPGAAPNVIKELEKQWVSFAHDIPLQYQFLDDQFNRYYQKEMNLQKLFNWFTLFAITIAAMGLFALSTFAVERRTKETGIRKVLGATVPELILLLSREFLILVAVSNLIAWPAAYWAMSKWLDGFAYKISISVQLFLVGAAISILVAMIAVGYQSVKAAVSNPVRALRYE